MTLHILVGRITLTLSICRTSVELLPNGPNARTKGRRRTNGEAIARGR
jgi:hypothetical protein